MLLASLWVLVLQLPALHSDFAPKLDQDGCFRIAVQLGDQEFSRANDVQLQSEYVFPAIEQLLSLQEQQGDDAAQQSQRRPRQVHTVLVDMPLTRWSIAMLKLAQPSAVVVHSNESTNPRRRQTFMSRRTACGPTQSPLTTSTKTGQICDGYFKRAGTFELLRAAAARRCRVDIPRTCEGAKSPFRVAILSPHGQRPLLSPTDLVSAMQASYKGRVDVVYRTTFEDADFCEQVRWFTGVDAVIAGHERSTINSIFLPPGALLLEAMPRGDTEFCAYKAGLAGSGVRVQQVEKASKLATYVPNRYLSLVAVDVVRAIKAAGSLKKICTQQQPPP